MMLELCKLDPRPRSRTELALSSKLEGWRIEHYGDAILDVLDGRSAARAS